MAKKLQVFISSTYEDLKDERKRVLQLILEEGHIPAGMELFGQDDRTIWQVIQKWIDESDVVIFILKNRYGSICETTGKSYTQMEYEYAKEKNKKLIPIIFATDLYTCDNPERLKAFKDMVQKNSVNTPIKTEFEMAHRITDKLKQYAKEIEDGWVRISETSYDSRYRLMQFLMFADDQNRNGFNRFNIAPKIMMLMDKNEDYNQVKIGRLDIYYSIESRHESNDNVYDCKRRWKMSTVRNESGSEIKSYSFYTSTDIGKRKQAALELKNCIDAKKLMLNENKYKNNGVSCWRWAIEPSINSQELMNDMVLEEFVEEAWNFNRKQEIVYFIPKCFGVGIDVLSFTFEADKEVPILEMDLYEVIAGHKVYRHHIARLTRGPIKNNKRQLQ